MTRPALILYWARRDFRLLDNPALTEAIEASKRTKTPFIPLYCVDKEYIDDPINNISYSRKVMLYRCISSFNNELDNFCIFQGNVEDIFLSLSKAFQLTVFCNDDIEPYSRLRDKKIFDVIEKNGGSFNRVSDIMSSNLGIRTQSDTVYTVFTHYKNAIWKEFVESEANPKANPKEATYFDKTELETFLKSIEIGNGFIATTDTIKANLDWMLEEKWQVIAGNTHVFDLTQFHPLPDLSQWDTDESKVIDKIDTFIKQDLLSYSSGRDLLGIEGTSKMSYALKWGIISPRSIVTKIRNTIEIETNQSVQSYVSELIWREFYKYILYHFPHLLDLEYLPKRRGIEWVEEQEALRRFEAWMKGRTGFEIVDAGMMQIATIGWMHNRTRMVTASVLTKNLGVDWRWGQDYFRACLVDMDEASNSGGWQWAASVGVDPKPIRIFNPYLQEKKFDPSGAYRRHWLGDREPVEPIIDYKTTREQALIRYGLK